MLEQNFLENKSPLKILIIGYSYIAKKVVIPAIMNNSLFELVGIASKNHYLEIPQNIKSYRDYDDALKNSGCDAVYVSLHNSAHFDAIMKCLEYGKHVIVDKPSVMDINEAKKCFEIANKKGLLIFEALAFLYHEQHKILKQQLKSQQNPLQKISIHFGFPSLAEENFRNKKEYGGGCVYDLGPYLISTGEFYYGKKAKKIYCSSYTPEWSEVPISASAVIEYEDDEVLTGNIGFNQEYQNKLELWGKEFHYFLDRAFTIPSTMQNKIILKSKDKTDEGFISPCDHFSEMLSFFCMKIKNKDDIIEQNRKFINQAIQMQALLDSSSKKRIETPQYEFNENPPIGVWNYSEEYKKEKSEIFSALKKVFESGKLILGESVKNFEEEFAKYNDMKYGIGVNSGTDALFLALKTLDIGVGDEVITVPNTAVPTVSAIVSSGATPVFVDINTETFLIDENKIEEKITSKTKCILPVHLYGQCCNMEKINEIAKKHNLFVVEDCAQATGSLFMNKKAGSMSDISCFSFYPTKILGTYGDGGMLLTNNEQFANKAKMLRMYGMESEYYSKIHGYNSRLDEIHAEILRTKLRKLDSYIEKRKRIAERYYEKLKDTPLILPKVNSSSNSSHAYYVFVVKHPLRDDIIEFLKSRNINVNVSYKYPIHTMEAYSYLGYKNGYFPETERVSKEIFSLPMYPELKPEEQDRVIVALKEFFGK